MTNRYGWVMVALGAFMTCIAIGAMFSLAVFLQPITEATGWSHTAVSSAMTIGFLAMGAAGFGWGALSDRIGPRSVVPASSSRAARRARCNSSSRSACWSASPSAVSSRR
jgi:MFS family permease